MEATKANDYAVAKALNSNVVSILSAICMADTVGVPEDHDIKELNRVYVLLVNELQKLYDRNPELAAIKPGPIWQQFDLLTTSTWDINEYLSEHSNDELNAHTARVEKLCIIAGKETHDYSPEQKKLIEYTKTTMSNYFKMIEEAYKQSQVNKQNNWLIPEYTLTFNFDGTILINDVLKLKKVHASSTTERLLDQAIKNPNTLFKPDIGQTSRNLSTVLSGAGFTNELRALFFPVASKSRGVFFRPIVTRQQADDDKIDTTELDFKLKELGAKTEPKST